MGLGGISIWQLLIVLAIVILVFGTKRLKNIGSDVGGAVKGFKSAMNEEEQKDDKAAAIEKKEAADETITTAKTEEKDKQS